MYNSLNVTNKNRLVWDQLWIDSTVRIISELWLFQTFLILFLTKITTLISFKTMFSNLGNGSHKHEIKTIRNLCQFAYGLWKILPKPTISWMLYLKEEPRHSDKPTKIYFIAKRIKTVNKCKSVPEFVSYLLISWYSWFGIDWWLIHKLHVL